MLWSYDIECEQWDRLVVAVALSERGDVLVMRSDVEVREWLRMLDRSDTVISHNGGAYDFIHLISVAPELRWVGQLAGGSILRMTYRGGPTCLDSWGLFRVSLDVWTGGDKGDTGLACECGEDCGGYCAIRRDLPPSRMRRLIDYCVRDCRVLLDAYRAGIERLEAEGFRVRDRRGRPRTTAGSVAWHTAAELAGIDPTVDVGWRVYRAGRRAYYGGRCEVGRVEVQAGHRYDVHAMYPWALTHDVPIGRCRTTSSPRAAARCYARDPLAQYYARVQICPEERLPPLPHRQGGTRERLGRLVWATGTVEGWWTGIELRAAETVGARIERILAAVRWDGAAPLYEPYVRHAYAARQRARAGCSTGRDGCRCTECGWSKILKVLANALSGKLAQRPDVSTIHVLGPDDDPADGWEWLGGPVWASRGERLSACARPHQAAVVTARARVRLLERLSRHDDWVYCDTDSTYLTERDDRDVDPSRLGAWGYEGAMKDWRALAPKVYCYRDEHGEWRVKAKGVPRSSIDDFRVLMRGGAVTRRGGVARIRSSGGEFRARLLTRQSRTPRGWCGLRTVDGEGVTWPLCRDTDGTYRTHDGRPCDPAARATLLVG